LPTCDAGGDGGELGGGVELLIAWSTAALMAVTSERKYAPTGAISRGCCSNAAAIS